jgi:hypothetical protein
MLRILLLVIVGLIFAMSSLKAIGAAIALVLDLRKDGAHAPEILGALSASVVISLALGWLLRKIYFQKAKAQ